MNQRPIRPEPFELYNQNSISSGIAERRPKRLAPAYRGYSTNDIRDEADYRVSLLEDGAPYSRYDRRLDLLHRRGWCGFRSNARVPSEQSHAELARKHAELLMGPCSRCHSDQFAGCQRRLRKLHALDSIPRRRAVLKRHCSRPSFVARVFSSNSHQRLALSFLSAATGFRNPETVDAPEFRGALLPLKKSPPTGTAVRRG